MQYLPLRLATLALVVLFGVGLLAHRDRAPSAAAAGENLCAQIPTLLTAVDYTLATWPPDTATVPETTKAQLLYFANLVRTDYAWCAAGNTGPQPDLVSTTSHWLFGNASEALASYQQAAQGQGAAPAPPPPKAVPSATATPGGGRTPRR